MPTNNGNTTTIERSPTAVQISEVRKMLDLLEQQGAGDAAKETGASLPPGNAAPARGTRQKRRAQPMTTPQNHPLASNAPSFADLLQAASDLGSQAGLGKDVQIKFDLKLAEAAYLGSLSLDVNKHGPEMDDATKLSEAYVRAQGSAIVFDAKAPNQRKTISNARKMIKLGSCPKWGVGEPMGTINSLITLRQKLRQNPANSKKLDDAHNTLMRYATAQLKRDTLMAEDELSTYCFKREAEPRTAEEVIEAIRKTANNLKVGKISNCPDLDASPEVQAIINACTKRLTTIAKAKGAATP